MIWGRESLVLPSILIHWLQLDKYDNIQWTCPEDAAKYKQIVEKKSLYKFLIGLNKSLGVPGRILGTKPLTSIPPNM